MNIQTWLSKFTKNVANQSKIVAIVQPDGVYFSGQDLGNFPTYLPLSHDWQETLLSAFQDTDGKDIVLDIVLHSSFYHTYQIDKPSIPQQEWEGALPFLLKDLTSEKVVNIVAQAVELPHNNKIQCYVITKSLVMDLIRRLNHVNVQLTHLLIEDDVWAHVADAPNAFLLLQRSKKSQYKVSAMVAGTCVFQRTIRGVPSPLVGPNASGLQLDSIALELQRSVDYLSSQLKGTSIHQLKVCCDDEDSDMLAQELNQRLNVNVTPLAMPEMLCGTILATTALQGNFDINLYLESLKPRKEPLGLVTVLTSWGVVALALCVVWGWLGMEHRQLSHQITQLKAQQATLKQQSDELSERLEKHQPSPTKIAAAERLKRDIKAHQASLASLQQYNKAESAGFSGVMHALANISRPDISLNYIKVDGRSFDLRGLARTPEVVPSWIKQFKQELNLVGRSFDRLSIGRNEQQLVTFELSTKREAKE